MALVAFQGESGSYSEAAILEYFHVRGNRGTETSACKTFDDALQMVEDGDAQYAFIPVENTLEGSIEEPVAALLRSDLHVVGEMRYKVDHCLIGHPGADVNSISDVYSHPYALRQCQDFLRPRKLAMHPTGDTAGAVREVKQRGNILEAAIGSAAAAEFHGMEILQRGIQSREHNYTRFWIVSDRPYKPSPNKKEEFLTTVMIGVRDGTGELYKLLGHFATRGLNITKLETRPRLDRPWSYFFLLDIEGNKDDDKMAEALAEAVREATSVKVLGSYPTWEGLLEAAQVVAE